MIYFVGMQSLDINPQFEQVLNFVNQTSRSIFLTGKAGTGKTTLLRHIQQNTFKQMAIVAPTGVAAINAGGTTIHSFFQFPFTPFLPLLKANGEADTTRSHLPTLKYTTQRLSIFRNLELLIIDEISMVRADLLDQIDVTLRQTRKKHQLPFGGVQLLFIGDMYQLPPVVQSDEWQMLRDVYPSPYFFESLVIKHHPPVYIELEKVYRQSDARFIDLLNQVRHNQLSKEGLQLLNSHYQPQLTEEDYRRHITLTTHNKKADEINTRNLTALPGDLFTYTCKTEGQFPEKNFPADEVLQLKVGTRVMFLKNNTEKNYFNGKIGIVTQLEKDKIKVRCNGDQQDIEVQPETWNQVNYKVDKSTKHIEEEILGSFRQFPLRLAWAITIHKSQGLTFDELIIDAADSFSAGQVYVALSRCRSLDGLILSSKVQESSLLNDQQIVRFSESKPNRSELTSIYSASRKLYLKTVILGIFDFGEFKQLREECAALLVMHKQRLLTGSQEWLASFFLAADALVEVSKKFVLQLTGILESQVEVEADPHLKERISKASSYFEAQLDSLLELVKACKLVTENKEAAAAFNETLQSSFELLYLKRKLVSACKEGFDFNAFIKEKLQIVYPEVKINVYASSRNSKVNADVLHPDLYRKLLLLRDEICNEEQMPVYMVANSKTLTDLSNFLPGNEEELMHIKGFGEARVEAFGRQFLKLINAYKTEHGLQSNLPVKGKKKSKKSSAEKEDRKKEGDDMKSADKTFQLFEEGLSPEQIARQRGLGLSTIQSHLTPFIANGKLSIDKLVDQQTKQLILDALEDFEFTKGLKMVKDKLPEHISYAEIRYVLADKVKTVD